MRKLMVLTLASVFILGGCSSSGEPSNGDASMNDAGAEEAEFQEDFAAIAIATCTSPDESDATTDDNELESDEFTMRFN